MNPVVRQYRLSSNLNIVQYWRHALAALILLSVWTLFLYRDTGIAIVTIWARSETFTHGFLVPPISLWLVWRRRNEISAYTPNPSKWALLAVAGAAAVWLLGDLAAVNAVTQLAFTALLVLAVPALMGLPITRVIIFPLGFLFFAVPIGEFLLPQLMEWTASFTVFALRLSGIPVNREGLQFVIPSGNWSVVEACSGVRYLIASLTVGALFAYLNYQSAKRRILFAIVSILVPIVANWLRAYMIVMLGHFSGNKLAVGVDHLIYGWLFFGVVIMLMFIIGARWAEPENLALKQGSVIESNRPPPNAIRLWASSACFAILVALPHIALWVSDRGEVGAAVLLEAPTALATDWRSATETAEKFKPAFQNPSAELNSGYVRQGRTVGLYVGYYRHQNYNRKLVSSNNVLVSSNDAQWAQVVSTGLPVSIGGRPITLRKSELRSVVQAGKVRDGRLVAWQIYWINGTITGSDYLAKAYSVLYRLMGRGDDSAVIIVYTYEDQSRGADALLESFLSTNYAVINELLLKTKQSQ